MIASALNFSIDKLCESSASDKASIDRSSEAERSPINSSAIANNRPTAINPASPAHDLREQAVGVRSPQELRPNLSNFVDFSFSGNSVGAYLLQRRRDFRFVFAFEISEAS
jgi:hypothetical protein